MGWGGGDGRPKTPAPIMRIERGVGCCLGVWEVD